MIDKGTGILLVPHPSEVAGGPRKAEYATRSGLSMLRANVSRAQTASALGAGKAGEHPVSKQPFAWQQDSEYSKFR